MAKKILNGWKSTQDLAKMLSTSVGTVRQDIFKARNELSKCPAPKRDLDCKNFGTRADYFSPQWVKAYLNYKSKTGNKRKKSSGKPKTITNEVSAVLGKYTTKIKAYKKALDDFENEIKNIFEK